MAFGVVLTIIIRCVFALNALSTLYIYLSIYIAARRRLRVTDPHEKEKQITEARVTQGRANRKKALQNYKMAKSCAIVVGLVYISASSPGPTVTVVCRSVGIAWKTQSETRGRAWQKMQKKVYDSTKK